VTAVQLYFGSDINPYANLPHDPVSKNPAISFNSRNMKQLNLNLTVSNSGDQVGQVYVTLYSKMTSKANIQTIDSIDKWALAAMKCTVPTPMHWNNITVPYVGTWTASSFQYNLVGSGDAYVLVAILTCDNPYEAPSLSQPTKDPCVAVWADLLQ
jgi:hypothetical protein